MSRIGKLPIQIPEKVEITVDSGSAELMTWDGGQGRTEAKTRNHTEPE